MSTVSIPLLPVHSESTDCYDPHSDAYAGGHGLPDDIQAEINAFDDEVRMLRAAEELAEDSQRCEVAEAEEWIAEGFAVAQRKVVACAK